MTDHTRPVVESVRPQPARLVLGGREITVDDSPMASEVEEWRSVEVRSETPELVIRLRRRVRLWEVWHTILPIPVGLVVAVLSTPSTDPVCLWTFMGGFCLILLAVTIRTAVRSRSWSWVRFDRRSGRVVCERRVGVRINPARVEQWAVPLAQVVAVQLLDSGLHTATETTGPDGQQSTSARYELNLVLDDPDRRRVHLGRLADRESVRATGTRIGAFLGVPVLDRLHHGG
jgi:hypothetical protein